MPDGSHPAATRPHLRIVREDDDTEAFISTGEALDRALSSLGLEQPKPRNHLLEALSWLALLAILCGVLGLSVNFMIWALDLWAPGRIEP